MLPALMALVFCPLAYGREVKFQKTVDPGALQHQLRAAGFLVDYIQCSRDNCKIVMPDKEKKDPLDLVAKYTYVSPAEAQIKRLEAMRALFRRWEAGTITPAEKDELLKMLVRAYLGIE